MIRVKLEIWIQLGEDLGKDFQTLSDTSSILEKEIETGITVRNFFSQLAERYQAIREKIFERGGNSFYPGVVASLNDRIIPPHELYDSVLKEGDKITILPLFMGG